MSRKVLFLGDWYLEHPVDASSTIDEYAYIFNLEAPISKRGKPALNKICLRMKDNYILPSFGREPLAVCLANNHIMDYGALAFEDTLNTLSSMSIPFFGAGSEKDNFHNPAVVRVAGQRVALMGYVCHSTHPIYAGNGKFGVCPIELDRIHRDIQQARAKGATRVVVSLHWGGEELMLPKPGDVELARNIIDAGADVIVGHHAHVPQPVETVKGKPVAYGLGNFVMPDLEVPVYGKDGTNPVRIFKKKQGMWNRVSLGLAWDVKSKAFAVKKYLFSGAIVREHSNPRYSIRSPSLTASHYPLRFEIHLRKQRLLYAIRKYWENPIRFHPRHLVILFKTLTCPRR